MLALRNGTIIDGTGGTPYTGTVLVDGDRISLVNEHTPADTSFDCEGLAISPGFFDLHSHSDLQALDPARREKIKQGVTAELVGNCGFSPFPIGADAGQLREFARDDTAAESPDEVAPPHELLRADRAMYHIGERARAANVPCDCRKAVSRAQL